MNSITWRGVPSTDIEGLLICELPPITKPKMRTKETIIDGRDGSIIEELGYEPYDKPLVIGLHGEFDIDKVMKYFTGDGEVVFSNEPDKVYMAKICGKIDYTRLLKFRQATITFRVQPYKFKKDEDATATQTATASGTEIVVDDSADANLKAFKIYGKSTQAGTPTPDAPVDIVSVGYDGLLTAYINGINLFNLKSGRITGTDKAMTFTENGFVLDAFETATRIYRFKCNLKKGNKYFLSFDSETVSGNGYVSAYLPKITQYLENGKTFIPNEDTDELGLYVGEKQVPTTCNVSNVQVSLTSVKKNYEPYKNQTMTLANTLRAIPVTDQSLATYTDASGQMWCADEIDLERGVYVQRVSEYTALNFGLNGSAGENVHLYSAFIPDARNVINTKALSTHFKWVESGALSQMLEGQMIVRDRTDYPVIYCASSIATESEFNDWVLENNVRFLSILATPVEIPLTEEEIAMCKNLKSNEPTTTILNDENAYMSVEYFKPFEVVNEGLEESKPIMTLRGSGAVEVLVNGMHTFTYTFPEGDTEVVIDSEKEDAYLSGFLKNRNMNGEFPILQAGTNKIEWNGDIDSITIQPRSRWL